MKFLRLMPLLAVLLMFFLAPSVSGYYDPEKAEIPILYGGDDHPWGGEIDPSGGGHVDRLGRSDDGIGQVYFLKIIFFIWVPNLDYDRTSDIDHNNSVVLPGSFFENRNGQTGTGQGVD
ncbi:MAG TPA: hypothetical protein ENH25_01250 [candidate division Zixibacteria bacterium]|nr:hypothetical protein [candidate division Zixibacteria bacterium]